MRGWWNEGETWTLALPEDQFLTFKSYSMGPSAAMRAWIEAPASVGASRLPPLDRNPILRLRPAACLQLCAAIVAGFGLSSLTARAGIRGFLVLSLLASILLLCGTFSAVQARRHA